ncbi:MAG: flavin reductase family protein [Bacilli bacterium]|nr:flavin reductase family protein [Bacilli bacterium]
MSLQAFNMGCNVLAFNKDGKKYGMVCAWATQVDYDKIALLVGGQSVTGKVIKLDSFVGVSALAEGQEDIAHKLGENHSDEGNKFEGIECEEFESAVYVKGAKVKMLCQVQKIMNLTNSEDKFIILQVLKHSSCKSKKFLPLNAVYPEE